ncbi:MAG: helix-turn-helix domain-containing protein [Bacillota bacterium]
MRKWHNKSKLIKILKERDIMYSMFTTKATMTVPEAAKYLGISRSLAYTLIKSGEIPSLKLGEKRIIIPRTALERMLEIQAQNVNNEYK